MNFFPPFARCGQNFVSSDESCRTKHKLCTICSAVYNNNPQVIVFVDKKHFSLKYKGCFDILVLL